MATVRKYKLSNPDPNYPSDEHRRFPGHIYKTLNFGYWYRVFNGAYQNENKSWKASTNSHEFRAEIDALPWRNSFEEAQKDLDNFAKEHGLIQITVEE